MTAEGREGTPLCCITAPSFSSNTIATSSTSTSPFPASPSLPYNTSIAVTKGTLKLAMQCSCLGRVYGNRLENESGKWCLADILKREKLGYMSFFFFFLKKKKCSQGASQLKKMKG